MDQEMSVKMKVAEAFTKGRSAIQRCQARLEDIQQVLVHVKNPATVEKQTADRRRIQEIQKQLEEINHEVERMLPW